VREAREALSPVARRQLDAIEAVANDVRADLLRDPRQLLNHMTRGQQVALRRDPKLLSTYFGELLHERAAEIIRARARNVGDALHGVRVGSSRLAPDYWAVDGAGLDITTRTLERVEHHLREPSIDAVATYRPVRGAEHRTMIDALWPFLPRR
jgi:hypothetical protein